VKTVRDEIFDIISSTLEVKRSDIRLESTWEEESADSFALVEMLVALQEHFRIRFQTQELRRIRSVGDMVEAVERKVAGSP
jgi:acyl carrier protein